MDMDDVEQYYINGIAAKILTINTWQYVMLTSNAGFTVDNFDIGRVAANYFEGRLAEFEFWNSVLDADEISTAYDRLRGVYK